MKTIFRILGLCNAFGNLGYRLIKIVIRYNLTERSLRLSLKRKLFLRLSAVKVHKRNSVNAITSECIEHFQVYNQKRPYSALWRLTPVEFEQRNLS